MIKDLPSLSVALFISYSMVCCVSSLPEQSKWIVVLTKNNSQVNISRSAYGKTMAHIYIQCETGRKQSVDYSFRYGEFPCMSAPLGLNEQYIYDEEGMGDKNRYMMLPPDAIKCSGRVDPIINKPVPSLPFAPVLNDSILFLTLNIFGADDSVKVHVLVEITSDQGYLSPIDYPLLPFYGTMCGVYAVYAIVWTILCFRYLHNLLRIQHWIGAVIFLGMLEKAFFVAEFESVHATGVSGQGVLIAAELISCLKRTLARILFIIVSLGFGIVRPRLGEQLHQAVGLGFLFFFVSAFEGVMRVIRHVSDDSFEALGSALILSTIDSVICIWVLSSLSKTIRLLIMKKNATKLALYRSFRNTLLFAVIASAAFGAWTLKQHRLTSCITDFKSLWVEDAFWHVLFSILLLVVMFLWRPSVNSQCYAYSAAVDDADTILFEQQVSDAYGVKTRHSKGEKSQHNGDCTKADDDLKWVEENIPTSILDGAMMEDDDERKERLIQESKMQ